MVPMCCSSQIPYAKTHNPTGSETIAITLGAFIDTFSRRSVDPATVTAKSKADAGVIGRAKAEANTNADVSDDPLYLFDAQISQKHPHLLLGFEPLFDYFRSVRTATGCT